MKSNSIKKFFNKLFVKINESIDDEIKGKTFSDRLELEELLTKNGYDIVHYDVDKVEILPVRGNYVEPMTYDRVNKEGTSFSLQNKKIKKSYLEDLIKQNESKILEGLTRLLESEKLTEAEKVDVKILFYFNVSNSKALVSDITRVYNSCNSIDNVVALVATEIDNLIEKDERVLTTWNEAIDKLAEKYKNTDLRNHKIEAQPEEPTDDEE